MLNFLTPNVLELTNPIHASSESHPSMVKVEVLSMGFDLPGLSMLNENDQNVSSMIIVKRNGI